jgi:hypothetical protein|tara:strand:- start:174 stop:1160 length:987 start_codon:yes stop_codon:yes gene_type:complete
VVKIRRETMINAHKVIDYFNIHDVSGGPFFSVINGRRHTNTVKVKSHLAHVVELSGKFNLGQHKVEDFAVLAETGFDQLKANLVAMPYPYTYAEFELTEDSLSRGWSKGKYAVIIRNSAKAMADLSSQLGKTFPEQKYDAVPIDEEYSSKWYIHILVLDKESIKHMGCMVTVMTSAIQEGVAFNTIYDSHQANQQIVLDEKKGENLGNFHVNMMGAVHAIINAKGVDTRTVLPPEKLNKKRKKNGKTPLYSHNVVTIGGISSSGNIVGAGMKRASPRQHWRRGHIRTLPSGEKIAIQAMLINGRGFISKEYLKDKVEKSEEYGYNLVR